MKILPPTPEETELIKSKHNFNQLNDELDKVKMKVFTGGYAAFMAPLMLQLKFVWSTGVETAATNGEFLWWNPEFFINGPKEYGEPKFNEFTLRHELWHVANMVMLRVGNRVYRKLFFIADDIRINNDLYKAGHTWGSFPAYHRPELDKNGRLTTEEIYDILVAEKELDQFIFLEGGFDIDEHLSHDHDCEEHNWEVQKTINNVTRAITEAKTIGQGGDIPGGLEEFMNQFLAPVIPWEVHLARWSRDLLQYDYSWMNRDRRFTEDLYLPGDWEDDGRLEHLVWYVDVSGSVTMREIQRVASELKYIWDELKPKKMTIVQWDWAITKIDKYVEGREFPGIEIRGGGGTNVNVVRQHMIENKPTAAVIFTDMGFSPMQPLPFEIPILYISTAGIVPIPFGEIISCQV